MVISAVHALLGQAHFTTPSPKSARPETSDFSKAFRSALDADRTPETMHTVRRGDTLTRIVATYLKTAGITATNRSVHEAVLRVAEANGIRNPDIIQPGQEIRLDAAGTSASIATAGLTPEEVIISEADRVRRGLAAYAPPLVPHGPASATPAVMPAMRNPWAPLISRPASLTSDFGPRNDPFSGKHDTHQGIDLAARKGSAIYPYGPGRVSFSGWQRGYGNVVIVDHGDGLQTLYGHNQKNLVRKGEVVDERSVIGRVGSTGRATGAHLHFEVRKDGKAVDPMPYLENRSVQVALAL